MDEKMVETDNRCRVDDGQKNRYIIMENRHIAKWADRKITST